VRALAREVIHEFDTPARVIIVLTAAGAALGQWYLNNVVAGIAVGFALSLSINVIAMRRLAQVGGPDLLRPPADFDSAFDLLESLAIRERTRVGLVLTFAAALTLWLIPPVAPTSALILATGIALHFPALTAHRAPMRTTAVFVLWALGIITIAAAVAFRALAFFPELNSLTAREPVQAVVIAFLNTATLGLHEVLPGDGWFRVIALTHIALMAIAVGFWWIVSTLWRTRSDWKPNLESFNNDPVYQVIDVALVAAFAIVILKSSPGNVSTGWFVWTLLIALGRYPMYVVLLSVPSMKWRIQIFIRYVFTQLLWFALAFFAGSNSGLLTLGVDTPSGTHAGPLTPTQSLYLALGSLVTGGGPGITPLDDLTRLVVSLELLMPATFALWLFGAAAWLNPAKTPSNAADVPKDQATSFTDNSSRLRGHSWGRGSVFVTMLVGLVAVGIWLLRRRV
jgi:hypothetical protein